MSSSSSSIVVPDIHGYDLDLFELKDTHLIQSLICSICLSMSREAYEIVLSSGESCGHVFCKECITSAFKTKSCCPNCRKESDGKKIRPSVTIQMLISTSRIRCLHHALGC